jgi:hypothetical protein
MFTPSNPKPSDQQAKLEREQGRSLEAVKPTQPLFARFASDPTPKTP